MLLIGEHLLVSLRVGEWCHLPGVQDISLILLTESLQKWKPNVGGIDNCSKTCTNEPSPEAPCSRHVSTEPVKCRSREDLGSRRPHSEWGSRSCREVVHLWSGIACG